MADDTSTVPSIGTPTGDDPWAAAAQNATPPSTPSATPPTPPPGGNTQQPVAAAPTATPSGQTDLTAPAATPPEPIVITPQKPSGIMGVVDSIRDALTGQSKPELATDQFGNKYVKETTLSSGEKWARIGASLATGAIRGFAAGKGAGNEGKAAAAGLDNGLQLAAQPEQQRQQLTAEAAEANKQKANAQMQQMQLADQAWEAQRHKVTATQEDVKFSQGQEDRMAKDGGTLLGTVEHPGDIDNVMKADPQVMENLVKNGTIQFVPHLDANGQAAGFKVFKMPDNYRATILPAGTTFHTFDTTTGQYVEHHSADPLTAGERDNYEAAANTAALAWKNQKAAADMAAAKLASEKEEPEVKRSTIAKNEAEAGKASAEASKARTEAASAQKGSPEIAHLGEAIARGSQTLDQVPTKQKAAVEDYLTQSHPNLDQKSVTLNNDERKRADLAKNAMHNLDDIATRLQKRPDLLGIIAGRLSSGKKLSGTDDRDLSDINTALDNYSLAATGAHGVRAGGAREDAKEALLNHFKNGEGAIQSSLQAARGSLMQLQEPGKPRGVDGTPYVYKQQQPAGAPATAKQKAALPAGTAPPPPGQVAVQLPGKPIGYIPQSALADFQKNHTDATVY